MTREGGVLPVRQVFRATQSCSSCAPVERVFSKPNSPEKNIKDAAVCAAKLRRIGCYDVRTHVVPRQLEGYAFRVTVDKESDGTINQEIQTINRLIPYLDGLSANEDVAQLERLRTALEELKLKIQVGTSRCGTPDNVRLLGELGRIEAKIDLPEEVNNLSFILQYLEETGHIWNNHPAEAVYPKFILFHKKLQAMSPKERIETDPAKNASFINSHEVDFFVPIAFGKIGTQSESELMGNAARTAVRIIEISASLGLEPLKLP